MSTTSEVTESESGCCLCWTVTAFIVAVIALKVLYSLLKRPKSVSGDIVFITGAASGIGRQTAINLAKLGAKIVIADIDFTKAQQVAAEINDLKQTAIAVHCDVTSIESVKNAAKQARNQLGNPSILINNAGIVSGKPITESSIESIERVIKVNLTSHFYTIKEFLPSMIAQNKGHIVTIASVAGLGGVNKMTDYCASKYGAVGLDDALRQECFMG